MKNTIIYSALFLCVLVAGCQNTTAVNNPMPSSAQSDTLWHACKDELMERGFVIDFQNRTAGIIETRPLVGKQWFELWKDDSVTAGSVAKNSLQTCKRTVQFNINWFRKPQEIECIVNVDKLYIVPDSKSDSTKTDDVYVASARLLRKKDTKGSEYWDRAGRDKNLEQAILKSINLRLKEN